jgi:hypothetical protein
VWSDSSLNATHAPAQEQRKIEDRTDRLPPEPALHTTPALYSRERERCSKCALLSAVLHNSTQCPGVRAYLPPISGRRGAAPQPHPACADRPGAHGGCACRSRPRRPRPPPCGMRQHITDAASSEHRTQHTAAVTSASTRKRGPTLRNGHSRLTPACHDAPDTARAHGTLHESRGRRRPGALGRSQAPHDSTPQHPAVLSPTPDDEPIDSLVPACLPACLPAPPHALWGRRRAAS